MLNISFIKIFRVPLVPPSCLFLSNLKSLFSYLSFQSDSLHSAGGLPLYKGGYLRYSHLETFLGKVLHFADSDQSSAVSNPIEICTVSSRRLAVQGDSFSLFYSITTR